MALRHYDPIFLVTCPLTGANENGAVQVSSNNKRLNFDSYKIQGLGLLPKASLTQHWAIRVRDTYYDVAYFNCDLPNAGKPKPVYKARPAYEWETLRCERGYPFQDRKLGVTFWSDENIRKQGLRIPWSS
jgi:hypothetical protein